MNQYWLHAQTNWVRQDGRRAMVLLIDPPWRVRLFLRLAGYRLTKRAV